jgi:iron complex transport system ATP-binding protein
MNDGQRAQPAIELRNVRLRRGTRWILQGIDWSVPAGSCAAILGPNGSGKSTLTRILAGHVWPTQGAVRVLGGLFGETDLPALRQSIRLVQSAGPYDVDSSLTARQTVLTGFFGTLALYTEPTREMLDQADLLLQQVGLGRVADHIYLTLSSGERVRALIARALASRPRLLLLDEPTAGLDLLAREQVLATVQKLFEPARAPAYEPPTVVLITHHVEELPPAVSEVLLLDDGRVAARGQPGQVLQSEILSTVYRCPLTVTRRHDRFAVHVAPGAWEGLLG